MHPTVVKALLLGIFVITAPTLVQARPNPEPLRETHLTEKNALHAQSNPLIQLSDAFFSSAFYERMLSNPDFIKIQGITYHLWKNQTGQKHRR